MIESLSDIVVKTNGDLREKTLREQGFTGDDVRFVVKLLDDNGLTARVGSRKQRVFRDPLDIAIEKVQRIPFQQLYEAWKFDRKGTHNCTGRRLPPTERVLISGDSLFHGKVLPASQVLPHPRKVFSKRELAMGYGQNEFDVGATARVLETGKLYRYDGRQWTAAAQ